MNSMSVRPQGLDNQHIVFYQHGCGPILIVCTTSPKGDLIRRAMLYPDIVSILGARPGGVDELRNIRAALEPHHIRNGWFRSSPEVLEAAAGGVVDVGATTRGPGRRLTPAQAVEIFRAAHETSRPYHEIGARYDVSALAVGRIARGVSYPGLWTVEPVGDGTGGYYVSERADMAGAKYKHVAGKRGRK